MYQDFFIRQKPWLRPGAQSFKKLKAWRLARRQARIWSLVIREFINGVTFGVELKKLRGIVFAPRKNQTIGRRSVVCEFFAECKTFWSLTRIIINKRHNAIHHKSKNKQVLTESFGYNIHLMPTAVSLFFVIPQETDS